MPLMTKLVAASGGVALSVLAGSGIASAEPDTTAIANSTCTYPQVVAALTAQSPDVANQLTGNPIANGWLQQLIASPPEQRRQMIQEAQVYPEVQQNTPLINQVATTCTNF